MNDLSAYVTVSALPAFDDNYIWVLRRGHHVVVVDPGDAAPVLHYLQSTEGQLGAILVTHHHADHCGGVIDLLGYAGEQTRVFGPATERIPGATDRLLGVESVHIPGVDVEFSVMAVPGHTLGHLAYYSPYLCGHGAVFCGDTLFAAGCGRLFEGTPAQMHASLSRLAVLPESTQVFCAHEYTQANLRFAAAVEPDNPAVQARIAEVAGWRALGKATVPFLLETELATNPFLRCDEISVRDAVGRHAGQQPQTAVDTFAAARRWKDQFRG